MNYSDYNITINRNNSITASCVHCGVIAVERMENIPEDELIDETVYLITEKIIHSPSCHFGSHDDDYFEWCPACVREATEPRDDPAEDHMMTEMRAMKDLIDNFPTRL